MADAISAGTIDVSGVRVLPLALPSSFARDPSATPPDLSAAGDVALVAFDAYLSANGARDRSDDAGTRDRADGEDASTRTDSDASQARAILACFSSPLEHGFSTTDIAPLVLDKLRDVGAKKMQYTTIAAPVDRDAGVAQVLARIHRADTDATRGADPRGILVEDLAFSDDGHLVACVAGCSDAARCGAALETPRFAGSLAPPPEPGLLLGAALSAVHHPTGTAIGAAALVAIASAVLVLRRKRP